MLDDDSIMPWGKFKGTKMGNIPAEYLLWLYENDKCDEPVREYIEDNLDVIRIEIKRNNAKN